MKIKSNVAISDSGLLFNPATGESYSLNPIGAEILRLIKEQKSFPEIRDIVLSKYYTDESTFEKDFQDFVHQLRQNFLIDNSDEADA